MSSPSSTSSSKLENRASAAFRGLPAFRRGVGRFSRVREAGRPRPCMTGWQPRVVRSTRGSWPVPSARLPPSGRTTPCRCVRPACRYTSRRADSAAGSNRPGVARWPRCGRAAHPRGSESRLLAPSQEPPHRSSSGLLLIRLIQEAPTCSVREYRVQPSRRASSSSNGSLPTRQLVSDTWRRAVGRTAFAVHAAVRTEPTRCAGGDGENARRVAIKCR